MRASEARLISCLLLAIAVSAGCGRGGTRRASPVRLEVDVLADSGRAQRLRIRAPADTAAPRRIAEVWLAQVAPSRAPVVDAPLPEAAPDPVENGVPDPPALELDGGLKPPILRSASTLRVPPGLRAESVELDVRVAEDGFVSEVLWAGGSHDSARVAAASDCALSMRFYPALRAGRPVAVWCRQRFDFARH